MTVPATVVAYAQVGTGGALIQMPAQGRRAAVPDQAQGALLPVVELRALLNLCPCLPYDLRYFAGRPHRAGAKSVSSGLNGALAVLCHVQVHHRGLDALMPQQFFDGDDVQPVFQQVGGIGVAQGVHRDVFFDAGRLGSLLYSPLHPALG